MEIEKHSKDQYNQDPIIRKKKQDWTHKEQRAIILINWIKYHWEVIIDSKETQN